jgi:hypothetical protein
MIFIANEYHAKRRAVDFSPKDQPVPPDQRASGLPSDGSYPASNTTYNKQPNAPVRRAAVYLARADGLGDRATIQNQRANGPTVCLIKIVKHEIP